MATQRKTVSRRKASKKAKTSSPRARAKRAPARAKARPAKKSAPRAAKRPATKAPAKGAKPAAKPAARPPAKAAGKAGARPRPVVKAVAPQAAEVRPIGVLPPESRARSTPAHAAPAGRPRPVVRPAPRSIDPQGVQGVTEKDLKEFEQRLLQERAKISKQMGHLENNVLKVNPRDSAGDLSGYSFHMADAGTDAMEREKAFQFASTEGRLLMEINDALQRLYRGDYGVCEICGQPIARARLEAVPYARLCVSCKEKEERAGRTQGPVGQ
jgi:RNA polymerase-binding protein DksA